MNYRMLLIIFIFIQSSVWSEKHNLEFLDSYESPSGHIIIEHYYNPNSDIDKFREIWLVAKKIRSYRVLLYKYGRDAKVIFSPNEQWLVINDYLGSDKSNVLLFKKKEDLIFTELKDADVFKKSWGFLLKETNHKEILNFDHQYAEVLLWASDSNSFLLSINGHDNHHSIDPWLCVFDIKTMESTLKCDVLNRNVFHET